VTTVLSPQDLQFLLRAMRANKCVLFLGAGFSRDALNKQGKPIPAGWDLGEALWQWLEYDKEHGAYDSQASPLASLFDIAKRKKGDNALTSFLRERLLVSGYPKWYRSVAYPYWHRIYTTNVDDLVERIYQDAGAAQLDIINGNGAAYKERDSSLARLQYVKLNGSLDDASAETVTFGTRQYAARASGYDAWYDHFVRDYSEHATLLVGTQVNEPLFYRALESRGRRAGAAQELRLRSFLVSPKIAPTLIDSLPEFNVTPVLSAAEPFFTYLAEQFGTVPERETVLAGLNPLFAKLAGRFPKSRKDDAALNQFLETFEQVEVPTKPGSYRSSFLLGSAPQWADLALGLDAIREVTVEAQTIVDTALNDPSTPRLYVIAGHRGAGKSTLLMRTAVNLAASGYQIFHAFGEDVADPSAIARSVENMAALVALFIDDAEWLGVRLETLLVELSKLKKPPVTVIALRANAMYWVDDLDIPHKDIWIPDLTNKDIEAVIDVLERESMLFVMTGKPRSEIRKRFQQRADKQLLVAMKEVTTGDDFNKILLREYAEIEDPELRLLYLCACLASAESASLSRDQLLATSDLPPARLFSGLARDLRLVLVPIPGSVNRLAARHQLVAEVVVERAPKHELAIAYSRVLSVLAHDMDPEGKSVAGRRWFRLYKRLINHSTIYKRFSNNITEARAVYEGVGKELSTSSHYWLQFGSLELQFGETEFAGPYLATAESLDPGDWWIQNAKGHLLLLQGKLAKSEEEAARLRADGQSLLLTLIERYGDVSAYPYHTLVSHDLDWIEVWILNPEKRREAIESLRELIAEGCEAHPHHSWLRDLKDRVDRAYLDTAITPA
jgi:hypothetical protein